MPKNLYMAFNRLIDANKLEREGRFEEAKVAWAESRDLYQEICNTTRPDEQIGRRARIGLVKTTYKCSGSTEAANLLFKLVRNGDISPRTIDELRIYLGIKPKD